MLTADAPSSCCLAEWYLPDLTDELIDIYVARLVTASAAMRAEGADVHLMLTVAVPGDEVLYGVFDGCDPETVERTCERAGLTPERLSGKVGTRILHASESP
ncbi:hypothetical protein A5757_10430 [Mycobacterium sp. 852013-51886_SCH5428379]|uniref:hypothetical protein n=1 Tax=Mycobacterium sp. 852013-51886_SCH5428379 TaxID=1834111 RepID=UPI0007FBC8DF|nr:hypothetical protein [Mycobacterium sp. 852013-51886_SCH5428379]OBB60081.1 hypothetical protein A5757_10430 [Mycobacterium sp. 852013-51886_SCH5428379]